MFGKLPFAILATISLSLTATALAKGVQPRKDPIERDPNEKVCETVKPLGSRLATKRVCATRAEWADYRQQDRDAIDKAQRVGCLTQGLC